MLIYNSNVLLNPFEVQMKFLQIKIIGYKVKMWIDLIKHIVKAIMLKNLVKKVTIYNKLRLIL